MALVSGRPPLRLLDGGHSGTWDELDLEVMSQYKRMKEAKCSGCGRPLMQHLYNSTLGREEVPEDYMPYTIDCPAMQAVAQGQSMWKESNKTNLDSYHKGTGPDPGMGVYWISQGPNETLPEPDKS